MITSTPRCPLHSPRVACNYVNTQEPGHFQSHTLHGIQYVQRLAEKQQSIEATARRKGVGWWEIVNSEEEEKTKGGNRGGISPPVHITSLWSRVRSFFSASPRR